MATCVFTVQQRLLTTIMACLSVWFHGITGPLTILLFAFGIGVDLNRYWLEFSSPKRRHIGSVKLSVRVYVSPGRLAKAYLSVCGVLSLMYFLTPQACWPLVNRMIDTEAGIARWRFMAYPEDICAVSHGSSLMLTQIVIATAIPMIVAAFAISAQSDPDRFAEMSKSYVNLERIGSFTPWKAALNLCLFSLLVLMPSLLPYGEPTPSDGHAAKVLYPSDDFLSFLIVILVPCISLVMGVPLCAIATRKVLRRGFRTTD